MENNVLKNRKEKIQNFLKKNINYLQYILLAIIVYIGVYVRSRNLELLKDVTTGKYISLELDSTIFLRYAREIAEHGTLYAKDMLRSYPFGSDISNLGTFTSYFIAYLYKFLHIFNPNITLENCSSGKNVNCSIAVNLSDFNNLFIDFKFILNDGINEVESKETRVFVDTISPTLNVNSPENITYNSTKIKFNITVSENAVLEYYDVEDISKNIQKYLLFRKLRRVTHDKSSEFRRHVTMTSVVDEAEIKVDIDSITEDFHTLKKCLETVEKIVK